MPLKKLSVDEAATKLISLSLVIRDRRGLKQHEEARVDGAFSLLASGSCKSKKKPYLEFLQSVHREIGLHGVVLCTVLGPSSVLSLKDLERVNLVTTLRSKGQEIAKEQLQALADKYTNKRKSRNVLLPLS